MQSLPSTIGPYTVLGTLGQGGMGVVYRCEHAQTRQPAAVKTVRLAHSGLLQSLRREIRALARIRHPGVVRIFAEGVDQGLPWYAMELLDGITLRSYGQQHFQQTPSTVPKPRSPILASPGAVTLEADPRGLEARPPSFAQRTTGFDPGEVGLATASSGLRPASAGSSQPEATPIGWPSTTGLDPAPSQQPSPAGWPQESARPCLPDRHVSSALALVRSLCEPLAFLHGEGLVHGDLKPENILLRSEMPEARREESVVPLLPSQFPLLSPAPSLAPVLVDFGLTARFSGGEISREKLDMGWTAGGTRAYMAPEQVLGDLVDARADLYALGCILYELLVGHPPFQSQPGKSAQYRQLYEAPRPPSVWVEGVPPQLDALVLGLLAKQPQARLGHADVLAAELDELMAAQPGGRHPAPVERIPGAEKSSEIRPRPVLYRPALVGRQTELQRLDQVLMGLTTGTGRMLFLIGESGAGKTRLAMEAARRARHRGLRVMTGECLPLGTGVDRDHSQAGSIPLQGLLNPLQALADHCREIGPLETRRLLQHRAPVLAVYQPALDSLPGLDPQEAAPLAPEAAQLRLFSYLASTFETLAADQPLLLVLDDLQWADDLTLGFLEFLLQAHLLAKVPLLVLGTVRTEEVQTRASRRLQSLLAAVAQDCLQLGRLQETGVASMVADTLALVTAPPGLVSSLSLNSEGNPFFVAEYLRTAVDAGLLWRDTRGVWCLAESDLQSSGSSVPGRLPLPRSLRELIGRRLDGLPASGRELAEAAAVLGRQPSLVLLRRMTGRSDESLDQDLNELIRRQVLRDEGQNGLRFVHDKIREAAHDRLEPSLKKTLHRRAAEALAALPDPAREEHLAALGEHWEVAEEIQLARQCYVAAAYRMTERFALPEAERLFRLYLRLNLQPDAQSIAARLALGQKVLRPQTRYDEAQAQYQAALDEARRTGEGALEVQSLRLLGMRHWSSGRFEAALPLYQSGLSIARAIGEVDLEGLMLGNLAVLLGNLGREDEARQIARQALEIGPRIRDPQTEGFLLQYLAMLHWNWGQVGEAHRLFDRALDCHRRSGNQSSEAGVLNSLSSLQVEQGDFDQARQFLEQAQAIYHALGDRQAEALALGSMAYIQKQRDPQAARSLIQKALAIDLQLGNQREAALSLAGLADLIDEPQRFDEALKLMDEALAMVHPIRDFSVEGSLLGQKADLLRRMGLDLEEARDLAQQAEVLLQSIGAQLELAKLYCVRGHIELADHRSAEILLQRATDIAQQLNASPHSHVRQLVERLRQAQSQFDAGQFDRLHQGVSSAP